MRLRLPTVFRTAHLLLLHCVDDLGAELAADVVSFQELADCFVAAAASASLMSDGVREHWGDTTWLVHDLEDWGLLCVHRALARPLTAKSRSERAYVAGLSLSQEGRTAVRLLGEWLRAKLLDGRSVSSELAMLPSTHPLSPDDER